MRIFVGVLVVNSFFGFLYTFKLSNVGSSEKFFSENFGEKRRFKRFSFNFSVFKVFSFFVVVGIFFFIMFGRFIIYVFLVSIIKGVFIFIDESFFFFFLKSKVFF